jgi:hypothetical protein
LVVCLFWDGHGIWVSEVNALKDPWNRPKCFKKVLEFFAMISKGGLLE